MKRKVIINDGSMNVPSKSVVIVSEDSGLPATRVKEHDGTTNEPATVVIESAGEPAESIILEIDDEEVPALVGTAIVGRSYVGHGNV